MHMAFRLRPEYKDKLVGATVSLPPNGAMLDVAKALADTSDGARADEHMTSDPLVQGALLSMNGEHGFLLDPYTISENPDEDWTPYQRPETAVAASAGMPDTLPEQLAQSASAIPEAQHGDRESEYEVLPLPELQEIARERGIQTIGIEQAGLIEALEASDQDGGAGNGS